MACTGVPVHALSRRRKSRAGYVLELAVSPCHTLDQRHPAASTVPGADQVPLGEGTLSSTSPLVLARHAALPQYPWQCQSTRSPLLNPFIYSSSWSTRVLALCQPSCASTYGFCALPTRGYRDRRARPRHSRSSIAITRHSSSLSSDQLRSAASLPWREPIQH